METNQQKTAAFFFCEDVSKDPVALYVFNHLTELLPLFESGLIIDGIPVLKYVDPRQDTFLFVRTKEVLSHNYEKYLPALKSNLSHVDQAGLVNWHEGANAPPAVLTLHTTGDMDSGTFPPAHPGFMRNLIKALDDGRRVEGLDDFHVSVEGTHWSGVHYTRNLSQLMQFKVPLVDIEIGSTVESWNNTKAARAIATSLQRTFDPLPNNLRVLLCIGGMHFTDAYTEAVLQSKEDKPLALSHVLPNQWLVTGRYDKPEGFTKLTECVKSVLGGINAVVVHDKASSGFKNMARKLSDQLNIPLFNHKRLHNPADLGLWT